MSDFVSILDVHKSYNMDGYISEVLKGVNCTLEKGKISFLLGPSGSGKSTLLNLLGLLDKPTKGKIIFLGHDIATLSESKAAEFRAKHIGYIFQTFNLLPVLTVEENIEMPMLLHNYSAGQRKEKINEYLTAVGLEGFNKRKIGEISGGQRQRVAIARALVTSPDFVIADEPTANLDREATKGIMDLINELNREYATSFIICTHNENLISRDADVLRIVDGIIIKNTDGAL